MKKRRIRVKQDDKLHLATAFAKMREEYPEDTRASISGRMHDELKLRLNVLPQQMQRWAEPRANRRMGRPTNEAFEQHVLDGMIFASVQKVDNEDKAAVIANVCYSHDIIVHAAKKVQREEAFQSDHRVKNLKFRRTWIKGFLQRNAMRPRRITAQSKTLPSPEDVQAWLACKKLSTPRAFPLRRFSMAMSQE